LGKIACFKKPGWVNIKEMNDEKVLEEIWFMASGYFISIGFDFNDLLQILGGRTRKKISPVGSIYNVF